MNVNSSWASWARLQKFHEMPDQVPNAHRAPGTMKTLVLMHQLHASNKTRMSDRPISALMSTVLQCSSHICSNNVQVTYQTCLLLLVSAQWSTCLRARKWSCHSDCPCAYNSKSYQPCKISETDGAEQTWWKPCAIWTRNPTSSMSFLLLCSRALMGWCWQWWRQHPITSLISQCMPK